MIRIDMHLHSSFSDGTDTPDEIAARAAAKRISVLALTDHDNIDGAEPFRRACERRSIRSISGVELSSKSPFTAHILGYRLRKPEALKDALEWVIARRNDRNRLMCERLAQQGIAVGIDELAGEAKGRVVARPHFASLLVRKGYAADFRDAFSMYLAKGASAYVPREAYSPSDCVRIIREAGGLPVLAHPSLTGLDANDLGDFLEDLKSAGLWGLECMSSHCSSEQAFSFLRMAEGHALFPTAGSDFHGRNRPGITLGVQVSETFLPWARLGVSL
ncbi:MAG: PHP domain-containing protein [Synergistaceae bacterium]|jgi:predicted metal-dependent phosphoesterase TrpH|nr:PHP domain-containing protein [Synergistaceae bacterium]